MTYFDKKTLISIIKKLMDKEQFDLIKHYQACIEKSTVPLSYKIQFRDRVCYLKSDEGEKPLTLFIKENFTFIVLFHIIGLFEKSIPVKDLDKEYKRILAQLDQPTKRSLICFDQLYRGLYHKYVKAKIEFRKKVGC
jgi:hypothetical protein